MNTNTKIIPPHSPFLLPCGELAPVEYGKVYLSIYDSDPLDTTKQIPVYYIDEYETAHRVNQPLRMNEIGFLSYDGLPAHFYTYNRYSILVQNQFNNNLYFELVEGLEDTGIPAQWDFSTGGTITSADTVVFSPKNATQTPTGDNRWWKWAGPLPKVVPPNSVPGYGSVGEIGPGYWEEAGVEPEDNEYNLATMKLGVHEALRRSYAEAGLVMVEGSFEQGGTLYSNTEVLLFEEEGLAYSWGGAFPKIMAPGSTPYTDGFGPGAWLTHESDFLRLDLNANSGATLVRMQSGKTVQQAFDTLRPEDIGAMPIAGGTFTGPVTGPKFNCTTQPADADDLTRKDYVDAQILAGDNAVKAGYSANTGADTIGTGWGISVQDAIDALARGEASDPTLRLELASTAGAGMIGTTTAGKTVQVRINELQTSVDGKAALSHTHTPAEVGASPVVHTHTIAQVTNLQSSLDGKSPTSHTHSAASIGAAPAVHAHAIADVSGLQGALDGKAPSNHTHTPASIGAATANHTHTSGSSNSDIVAGGYGQVGTYTWSRLENYGGVRLGQTVNGASLVPVAMDVGNWDGGALKGSFTGTWKLLGDNDTGRDMAALYVRVA